MFEARLKEVRERAHGLVDPAHSASPPRSRSGHPLRHGVTRPPQAQVLKKIIEAIKDLVADAPIECSSDGISMQASASVVVALHGRARPCLDPRVGCTLRPLPARSRWTRRT